MYYFECPHCHTQTGLDAQNLGWPSSALHRTCHDCGQDGCRDCLSDEEEAVPLCDDCVDHRETDRAPVDQIDV